MSTLRSTLALVTAGSVGAVTAVAVTLLLTPHQDRTQSPKTILQREAPGVGERRVPSSGDDARIIRLERRLEGLAADHGVRGTPTVSQDASQPDWFDGMPPDEAEVVERTRQVWDAQVEAHEDAPTDAQWSGDARVSFERGLVEAAGELAGDVRVDCRTDSCLATVEFESYRDATTSFSSLLQHEYDLNCETSVAMPPPEDPGGTYGAEILFVCPDSSPS